MGGKFPDALPPGGRNALFESLIRLRRGLEDRASVVELEADRALTEEEHGVPGLYFPLSCLLCRLVSLPEGTTVKVSLIGREGGAGVAALIDGSAGLFRTTVQLPGTALFLPAREVQPLLELPEATGVLVRYMLLLLREASLTAACNRVHGAKSRLARWLLLIRDRIGADEFPLTHESLAAMLGVRRESVTVSANELRNERAIDYRRGKVLITDGSILESEACSCYGTITEAYLGFLQRGLPTR